VVHPLNRSRGPILARRLQNLDLVRVAVGLVAGYLLGGIPFGIMVPPV